MPNSKALLCLVFTIQALVACCNGKPNPAGTFSVGENVNGFKYIGESKKTNRADESTSLYFVSQVEISWLRARETCIDVLGYDSSLISVETVKESLEVDELLRNSGNSVQSYWTEGRFENNGRKQFSWQSSGELVELGNPLWAENEPSESTAVSKLAMVREKSSGNYSLRSINKDENHVFICEMIFGSSENPVPCFSSNDLVIAVDSSGSITKDHWPRITEFAVNVATAWTGWDDTRLAYIVFSSDANVLIPLDNTDSERGIANIIKNSDYIGGWTRSDLALKKAFLELEGKNRTGVAVPRTVVFLTDGHSTSPPETIIEANNLHKKNVRCFSVGVGTEINQEELVAIATREANVFNSDNFASLKEVLKPLTSLACP